LYAAATAVLQLTLAAEINLPFLKKEIFDLLLPFSAGSYLLEDALLWSRFRMLLLTHQRSLKLTFIHVSPPFLPSGDALFNFQGAGGALASKPISFYSLATTFPQFKETPHAVSPSLPEKPLPHRLLFLAQVGAL